MHMHKYTHVHITYTNAIIHMYIMYNLKFGSPHSHPPRVAMHSSRLICTYVHMCKYTNTWIHRNNKNKCSYVVHRMALKLS